MNFREAKCVEYRGSYASLYFIIESLNIGVEPSTFLPEYVNCHWDMVFKFLPTPA